MKMLSSLTVCLLTLLCYLTPAWAHFGMVIPDLPIISQPAKKTSVTLSFSHPFEKIGMRLEKPRRFAVTANGKTTDLTTRLQPSLVMGKESWKAEVSFTRPGVYHLAMEPEPYWEPAEDSFIIHYTKTIVPAFGDDTGWDEPVGLPTEILPLTRPFGNYSGNSFTGQVFLHGKPVSESEVEVEYYSQAEQFQAPTDYHITQVVKTDANGVFTFTCSLPGWWGFAALNTADYTIKNPEGADSGVELGAVFWMYLHPLPTVVQ